MTARGWSRRAALGAACASAGLGFLVPVAALRAQTARAGRVVAIGGAVTEIVYALGEGDRLIGRDSTSTHPEAALDLPDVGYMRALSPEGVLSLDPDLVIAEDGAGPPEAIAVLNAASVDFVTVPEGFDDGAVGAKVRVVARALGVDGEPLAARIEREIAAASRDAGRGDRPRVLFVLSLQGDRVMASGTGTAADGIIGLAGGQNAVAAFTGYRQMTDEAVIGAAPDVILMMDRGDHAGGRSDLAAHPALATTPAVRNGAVVRMDGLLLLGFGPRTPEAVRRLAAALDTAAGRG
ncbi:ABC transporter substrate-binding protein [Rhodobacterales bacterium HKCCE2091]|nr:ABC transporter substrate-binding protein [Rhodobacterales bacterium HKCCE2091]